MNKHKAKKTVLFILTLILFVFAIFPFLMILLNSFKDNVAIIENPLSFFGSVGFDNYIAAFKTMNFMSALLNTIIITVGSLLLLIVFSSMLAYFLARWDWKANKVILLVLIASMIIPFQTVMIPLVAIYGRMGILNTRLSLIIFYLGFGVAMATFMYHGFIQSIPVELEEAATIDGCSNFRRFWQIVFPLLSNITSTIIVLDLLWIWNDYLLPSLVLVRKEQRTLPLTTFYFFGTYSSQFGYGMAALVMTITPILVIYLFAQDKIINGVVEGAIK